MLDHGLVSLIFISCGMRVCLRLKFSNLLWDISKILYTYDAARKDNIITKSIITATISASKKRTWLSRALDLVIDPYLTCEVDVNWLKNQFQCGQNNRAIHP